MDYYHSIRVMKEKQQEGHREEQKYRQVGVNSQSIAEGGSAAASFAQHETFGQSSEDRIQRGKLSIVLEWLRVSVPQLHAPSRYFDIRGLSCARRIRYRRDVAGRAYRTRFG